MSTNRDAGSSGIDARDSRRWLIGIAISIVFGLFSTFMALLGYFAGPKPAAAPSAKASAARDDAEPARRGKARGERRK